MARFDGQVVWITGGGTGIGLACAVEFARQGAKLAISGRREDRLQAGVAAIEAAGGEALAVACDVTAPESCQAAVERIVERFGRLDVAVANAGFAVANWTAKLEIADWRRQFETNVFGALHTVEAARQQIEQNNGRLVLVGSVVSYVVPPKMVPYAASKHALRAIAEGYAAELRSGSCTLVCPGFVESEIDKVDNRGVYKSERKGLNNPLKVPADAAARQIVSAVHRRAVVAPITWHGAVIVWLARHFPWLARLIVKRF
jgi:NAD(P)-dependent dehydrogenase (short-subunit alcohol dehydrogenase family)